MAIVGPRPTLAAQVDDYTPHQRRRLEVKPGLTGWAQVNGRAGIPWEERIELDVWYVEHRSPRPRPADPRPHGEAAASPATACMGSVRAVPKAEVKLRDFRPDDAEAVHRWFNDERVTADLVGSRDSFTLEDAAGWVERAMDTSEDRKWAITIDGDDAAVGFVALFGLDRQLGPELAVLVGDPSAWGKGVAREAERQACNRAFAEYDAHRIHAEIPATNEAAQKVVTYLGFQQEGVMRKAIRRGGRTDRQPGLGSAARGLHRVGLAAAELIADGGAAVRERRLLPLAQPSSRPRA